MGVAPPLGGGGRGASLGPPKKTGEADEAGRRSPGGQGQLASTGLRWRPCRPEALYNVAGSSREGHLPSLDPAEGRRFFFFEVTRLKDWGFLSLQGEGTGQSRQSKQSRGIIRLAPGRADFFFEILPGPVRPVPSLLAPPVRPGPLGWGANP